MRGLHLIHRKRVSLRLGHLAALEHLVPFTTARPLRYAGPYRKCVAMHKVVGAIHESPESLPCVKGSEAAER